MPEILSSFIVNRKQDDNLQERTRQIPEKPPQPKRPPQPEIELDDKTPPPMQQFDLDLPEFTLFDSSGNRKVGINPNDSLSTPGQSDISITNIGTSVNGTGLSVTSTSGYSSVESAYVQSTASSNFTITTAGSWEVTGLSNEGNLTGFLASTTGLPSVSATTTAPAYNYYPSNLMGYHQSYSNGATCYVYLYLSCLLYTSPSPRDS